MDTNLILSGRLSRLIALFATSSRVNSIKMPFAMGVKSTSWLVPYSRCSNISRVLPDCTCSNVMPGKNAVRRRMRSCSAFNLASYSSSAFEAAAAQITCKKRNHTYCLFHQQQQFQFVIVREHHQVAAWCFRSVGGQRKKSTAAMSNDPSKYLTRMMTSRVWLGD